jgi:hypothetical protein
VAIVSMVVAVFVPILLFVIVAAGLYVSYLILPRIIRFFQRVGRSLRGDPRATNP